MERAGIPTVLLCNLVSIALQDGAPRIVPTRGIGYPTGDPTIDPADERRWRQALIKTALRALSTGVTEPTVFQIEEKDRGDDHEI